MADSRKIYSFESNNEKGLDNWLKLRELTAVRRYPPNEDLYDILDENNEIIGLFSEERQLDNVLRHTNCWCVRMNDGLYHKLSFNKEDIIYLIGLNAADFYDYYKRQRDELDKKLQAIVKNTGYKPKGDKKKRI